MQLIAGWLVLAIDNLRLALPQREVRLIELLTDLAPSASGDVQGDTSAAQAPSGQAGGVSAIGWLLRRQGAAWPVYALDAGLHPQPAPPPARRLCVFIGTQADVIGFACDRVQLLATDAELTVEPVPGCMTGMASPITGFARHQKGITSVVTAAMLAAYLVFLREHGYDAHQ